MSEQSGVADRDVPSPAAPKQSEPAEGAPKVGQRFDPLGSLSGAASYDPTPVPKPPVTFQTEAARKRVYNTDGKPVARFDSGRFTTSDPDLIATLDGLSDVRRA